MKAPNEIWITPQKCDEIKAFDTDIKYILSDNVKKERNAIIDDGVKTIRELHAKNRKAHEMIKELIDVLGRTQFDLCCYWEVASLTTEEFNKSVERTEKALLKAQELIKKQ